MDDKKVVVEFNTVVSVAQVLRLTLIKCENIIIGDSITFQPRQLMENIAIKLYISMDTSTNSRLTGPISTAEIPCVCSLDVLASRNLIALLIFRNDSEACFIAFGPIETSRV